MGDEQDRKLLFDVGRFLFEKRKELSEFLKPIREWFRTDVGGSAGNEDEEVPRILMIGPGGVGKSTLSRFLTGNWSDVSDDVKYIESLWIEEFELDSPRATIIVPPGQPHRRNWTWSDIERKLTEGDFQGVLLINAFGYHTIGSISYTSLGLPMPTPEAFLEEYLKQGQKEEVAIVDRLAPFLSRTPQPLWLLCVVMKQDLWFDQAAEVDRLYRIGAFGKAISRLLTAAKDGTIRHEVAALSLIHQNFATGRSELLKRTVAGYDWEEQIKTMREFVRVLNELRTWEAQT